MASLSGTVYVAEIDPNHPLMRVAKAANWVLQAYRTSKKDYSPPTELAEALGALSEALESSRWYEVLENDE